jgi:Trypsin-like peptidase domain
MAGDEELLSVLRAATVRIDVGGVHSGTGFFVASGHVVTCHHVVEPALVPEPDWGMVGIHDSSGTVWRVTDRSRSDKDADLASLRLDGTSTTPVVRLDDVIDADDRLYTWGFPTDKQDGVPATFETEGRLGGQQSWIKFKAGQVVKGMSGAPLLNRRTGGVAGIMKRTRDADQDIGGLAISVEALLSWSPYLAKANSDSLRRDRRWWTAMTASQRERASSLQAPWTTRSVDLIIDVTQEQDRWSVTGRVSSEEEPWPPEPVDLNTVRAEVARLFRLLVASDRMDEVQKSKLLGQVLARAVLPPHAEKAFNALIAQPDLRVDVSLHFQAGADDDIVYLPWEMLLLPGSTERAQIPFGSLPRLTLARVLSIEPAAHPPVPRVDFSAAMIRAPDTAVPGRPVQQFASLTRAALAPALPNEPVDLGAGSATDLEDFLAETEVDVVHYIGYGRFQDRRDEIALNGDPLEKVAFLAADEFAASLSLRRPPLMVVLQPCDVRGDESARVVPADLAAMAPELLLHGTAAVLVLPIAQAGYDPAEVVQPIYRELVAGHSVQEAVQALRSHAVIRHRPWMYPALFLRYPGALRLARRTRDGDRGSV